MSDTERPELFDVWRDHRGSMPLDDMKRGMVFNLAWFPPPDVSWKPMDVTPQRDALPIAQFRLVDGVLLGRWSDGGAWGPV